MTIAYKDGKDSPQKGDKVMGTVAGIPVRGTVLSVPENLADSHTFILQRRAAYTVDDKKRRLLPHPLPMEHAEVIAADFSLVYRHVPRVPEPVENLGALSRQAKAAAKGRRK